MKKLIVLVLGVFIVSAFSFSAYAADQKTKSDVLKNSVVVTYDLFKIPSNGSNQVAIWVEDTSGNFVQTLYATKFTATGGYVKRPASLKTWVVKSDWENATKDEIDGISSATPAAGPQKVVWNCKNKSGVLVPDVFYKICMEGNLRSGKMMYAKALIKIGKNGKKVVANMSYEPEDGKAEPLFENVLVEFIK